MFDPGAMGVHPPTTIAPMSKTENAQKALQAVYDFQASGESDRIDKMRIARAKNRPKPDPDEFIDLNDPLDDHDDEPNELDIERMSAFESLIAAAQLDREAFFTSVVWLAERHLLDAPAFILSGRHQLPGLSPEGEDIIDLGLTVDEWYHGAYKRRHYAENTSTCGVYMGSGFDPNGERADLTPLASWRG